MTDLCRRHSANAMTQRSCQLTANDYCSCSNLYPMLHDSCSRLLDTSVSRCTCASEKTIEGAAHPHEHKQEHQFHRCSNSISPGGMVVNVKVDDRIEADADAPSPESPNGDSDSCYGSNNEHDDDSLLRYQQEVGAVSEQLDSSDASTILASSHNSCRCERAPDARNTAHGFESGPVPSESRGGERAGNLTAQPNTDQHWCSTFSGANIQHHPQRSHPPLNRVRRCHSDTTGSVVCYDLDSGLATAACSTGLHSAMSEPKAKTGNDHLMVTDWRDAKNGYHYYLCSNNRDAVGETCCRPSSRQLLHDVASPRSDPTTASNSAVTSLEVKSPPTSQTVQNKPRTVCKDHYLHELLGEPCSLALAEEDGQSNSHERLTRDAVLSLPWDARNRPATTPPVKSPQPGTEELCHRLVTSTLTIANSLKKEPPSYEEALMRLASARLRNVHSNSLDLTECNVRNHSQPGTATLKRSVSEQLGGCCCTARSCSNSGKVHSAADTSQHNSSCSNQANEGNIGAALSSAGFSGHPNVAEYNSHVQAANTRCIPGFSNAGVAGSEEDLSPTPTNSGSSSSTLQSCLRVTGQSAEERRGASTARSRRQTVRFCLTPESYFYEDQNDNSDEVFPQEMHSDNQLPTRPKQPPQFAAVRF